MHLPCVTAHPTALAFRSPAALPLTSSVSVTLSRSLCFCGAQTLVELEKLKMLREEVGACYAREQVNHFANCKEQAKAYVLFFFCFFFLRCPPLVVQSM